MSSDMKGDLLLLDLNTGEKFVLDHKEAMYKCGRGKENQVRSQSILASREHCMFLRANAGLNVIDLGSSNGIYVNGVYQTTRVMVALKINDIIGLGCPDTIPNGTRNPRSHTIYRLLRYEGEPKETASNETTPSIYVPAKTVQEKRRRQSVASPDCSVPSKIAKLNSRASASDIIDISDESNDESNEPVQTINSTKEEPKSISIKTEPETPQPSSSIRDTSTSLQQDTRDLNLLNSSSARDPSKKSSEDPKDANHTDIPKPTKSSSPSDKKKGSSEKNHCQKSPKAPKPKESRVANSDQVKSVRSTRNHKKVKQKRNVDPADVSSNTNGSNSKRAKQRTVDEEPQDFLVPAFDIEELNLEETHTASSSKQKAETAQNADNSADPPIKSEPTVQEEEKKEDMCFKTVDYRWEGEAPTPIKLKRIKQEPKTRYSEFDVVMLSDDDEDVFPASQLFGDEDEDEVKAGEKPKDKEVDEERDIFEERRIDFPDTIVLSDSEDDENPWYDRLLRSQLLNESRNSLNSSQEEVATKLEEVAKVEEAEIGETVGKAEFAEEEKEEEEPLDEDIFEGAEDREEQLIKGVRAEIFDMCFAADKEEEKEKRGVGVRSLKAKASEAGAFEKSSERSVEEKTSSEVKRRSLSPKKSRESLKTKSPEEKRRSGEKHSPTDKSSTIDERLPRLPEKKVSSGGKIEKKRASSEKKVSDSSSPNKDRSKEIVQEPEESSCEEPTEKNIRSIEAKSTSSNEKSELDPADDLTTSDSSSSLNRSRRPIVLLTKLNDRQLQLVEPPFLVKGRARSLNVSLSSLDRSSERRTDSLASSSLDRSFERRKDSSASSSLDRSFERRRDSSASTSRLSPRKLTGKERKDLELNAKIKEKMQLKEQRIRRQMNKWAAECLPLKRKPVAPVLSVKERKEIASDRKERLKQIASEKRASDERQRSSAPSNRVVVKPKAKVTVNSRSDNLVKALEEQQKLVAMGAEAVVGENEDRSLERGERGIDDGSSEATEDGGKAVVEKKCKSKKSSNLENAKGEATVEQTLVDGKARPVVEKIDKSKKSNILEETIAKAEAVRAKSDSLTKEKVRKSPRKCRENVVNGDSVRQQPVQGVVKAMPRIAKVVPILTKQSGLPDRRSERETSGRILGKTLGISNSEECSGVVQDPRLKSGKVTKSVLKENRVPKSAGLENDQGQSARGQAAKKVKRVSFDDLSTRIDIYQIDPGNSLKKCVSKDAPLLVKKLPRCGANTEASCPKLEQFLAHIFNWNPVWLEEQKQFSTTPPVVDEKRLVPLLSRYSNFQDYYNVAEPLLALELWYGITRDCEVGIKQQTCFKYSIVNHSVNVMPVPSTKIHLTTLMLELVVSKQDVEAQIAPAYGDLVFFEYISNRKPKDACRRWKVFAYVTNVRQTVITSVTHFNRDLLAFVNRPHTLLTYTVMTKPLDPTDVQTNKVCRLRTIRYLRSSVRMVQALQNLPVSPLCNTILNPRIENYQLPNVNLENYPLVTKDKLNTKQLKAVANVTEAVVQRLAKVCLIQGPPGTGKSRVITNLVTQILYGNGRYQSNKKLRILVCAPSNAAVDEIVLRLLEIRRSFQKGNRFNMVRIGRMESMHPVVRDVSVTELAIKDVKKTAAAYTSPTFTSDSVEEEKRFLQARINALEMERSNVDALYQKQIAQKLKDIHAKYNLLMNRRPADRLDSKELMRLQRAAENTLLKGADVITCTLSSCYTSQMESIFTGKDSISVCIVDEATQSAEVETLIPLLLGVRTLVLVGDTNQLPATILSQKAKKLGLDQSLFARIQNAFDGEDNSPVILLDTQYRMSYAVAYWPNRYFYAGALKNAAEVYPFPFHCYKIINIDANQNEDKFSNTEEASFVANLIYTMATRSNLDHLVAPVKIGVITPYNNQKQLVTKKIRERMANVSEKLRKKIVHEVNTVDGFQGQERDVIIMSCVRSNGIGFLSDRQRLCVALTRAKHSLLLCGNFKTFKRDSMWNALLTDAYDRGIYVNLSPSADTEEIKKHVIR